MVRILQEKIVREKDEKRGYKPIMTINSNNQDVN